MINSFHFCMFFTSQKYFTFILERYFHSVKNSKLAMFFFQYFEGIALLSTSLHYLKWEICWHAYICTSINNSLVCISVIYSFLWLLLIFSHYHWILAIWLWCDTVQFSSCSFLHLEFVDIIASIESLFPSDLEILNHDFFK